MQDPLTAVLFSHSRLFMQQRW